VHIVAKFSEPVSVAAANATLEAAGVPGAKIVTSSGNILLIDTVVHEAGIGQKIVAALRVGHPLADSEINEVGANVGQDLQVAGILMIVVSLGLILIYVSLRFQWRFAVGAVVALIHDVLITLGVFSVMNIEINLPTLAAFLTVVGYSINDTIVVFDRIRENQRLLRGMRFTDLINSSITQMLGRTLLTSLTTLVVVALIFWQSVAGELRTFSLALIFGIIVGTYSSIYIASPVVMMFRQRVTAGD
ncbi:protein translocase subunit SecF, partial [Candidatus Poribacteria bacterium]|nr:protein translocase subunit SecF [Candidatus Poribacteria bacterium]